MGININSHSILKTNFNTNNHNNFHYNYHYHYNCNNLFIIIDNYNPNNHFKNNIINFINKFNDKISSLSIYFVEQTTFL
jgi:hypothetical protein